MLVVSIKALCALKYSMVHYFIGVRRVGGLSPDGGREKSAEKIFHEMDETL